MWDMNDIVEVRHVRDYRCYVAFDDGCSGEIDLSSYLARGPIFSALADEELFKQVRIEGGTLSWPNGADIAPERLYEMINTANHGMELTSFAALIR
jgi:hypothetical protein